jgi:hypothetical protein
VPPAVDDRAPRRDLAAEAATVKSRVDGWFAEAKAVDRARAPHPWFETVRQRLERGFRPEWELLRGGGPDVSASPAVAEALAAWSERARAYGGTGRVGGGAGGNVITDSFDRHLSAAVTVSFGGDGAVLGVELTRSSGVRAYDALALARAWALAEEASQLGSPPAAARALYAFDTDFLLAPPLPFAACGFDATFRPTGCTWPLKRSVHSQIELRALY